MRDLWKPSPKPHLRMKYHVWSCASYVGGFVGFRIGFGYTWRQAWEDWMRQR